MATFNSTRLGIKPIFNAPYFYWMMDDTQGWIQHTGDKITFVFQARESGEISHLGFYYYFDYGFTPYEQKVSLQGVTSLGAADGSTKSSATYLPDETWPGWHWVDMSPNYTCQRGEKLSIVIEYSGSAALEHSSKYITRIISACNRQSFPYCIGPDGVRQGDSPIVAVKCTNGQCFGIPASILYGGIGSVNNQHKINYPKQQALAFNMSGDWGEIFRVAGVRWQGTPQSTSGHSYYLKLYEGTIQRQSVIVNCSHSMNPSSVEGASVSEIYFDEDPLPDLSFGTEYCIAIAPVDENMDMQLDVIEVQENGNISALPGGNCFYYAERESSSNNWTTYANRRPMMDLIIDYWGKPDQPTTGMHLKFLPRYNSNLFIEHADDQIVDSSEEIEGEPHEVAGYIIGEAKKSYGGYKTVEVFKDPDTDCSIEYRIHEEQPCEELKVLAWEGMTSGLYRIVFRFRSETESDNYTDYEQWVRIP
jgi:hypothetical protein